jgi:hypothetical protein
LRVTEITETNQFLNYENAWNKILEKSGESNIFLTWDFLFTMYSYFGDGKKLKILIAEDRDQVIAIAPFNQCHYSFGRFFNYKVLRSLGYGADYTGIILTEKKLECLKSIFENLKDDDEWDFIIISDLPETSSARELIPLVGDAGPKFEFEQGKICPYITLPESNDLFLNSINHNLRKDLRRCLANLERDHKRVELKRYDELGSTKEGMEIFFKLHQNRWNSKFMEGIFSSKKVCDFYVDVAQRFSEKDWLALYFLMVDDEPVAVQYCAQYGQKMSYMLGGFDVEYSKYGVGNLITAKVIEVSIKKGIREYDFLKGDESYKFRWTEQFRRNCDVRVTSDKLASRAVGGAIKFLKQTRLDKRFGSYVNS